MSDLSSWISNHWNTAWALVIYFYRLIEELFSGTGRSGPGNKLERIKRIGPDLYWISVIIWGILLFDINKLVSFFGDQIHFRVLILIGFLVGGKGINKLKEIEEGLSRNILSIGQIIKIWSLAVLLHIVGFASLLVALWFMANE